MLVSPRRVLWPTDFSELSDHAGDYAVGLREVFGSELHIIHVVPPPTSPDVSVGLAAGVALGTVERETLQASTMELTRIARDKCGVHDVKTKAFVGLAWRGICQYAEDHQIDMIVIATHGRSGIGHMLLGSNAERVVQHAPCPVMVIKHPEQECLIE